MGLLSSIDVSTSHGMRWEGPMVVSMIYAKVLTPYASGDKCLAIMRLIKKLTKRVDSCDTERGRLSYGPVHVDRNEQRLTEKLSETRGH